MARLDCLPAELLIDIFSYLNSSDVKAVREVNNTLRHHSSPACFQSIVACARYQGLGAFQNIANHPKYSRYVQEIVFDGTVFVEGLAKSEDIYHRAQENFVELYTPSLRQRRTRWKRYQMLHQEQEDLNKGGVMLQTLVRALDYLPNVTSIVYSPHARLLSTERRDMRDLVPVGFTCYPTAYSRRGYTITEHAFRHVIRAIFMSNFTGIRRLKVERVRDKEHATEFSTEMFDMPTEVDLRAGRHLFRNLTDIELNMALRDVNFEHMVPSALRKPVRLNERLANFAELLATAKDIQHLALHISPLLPIDCDYYGHYLYIERFLCHQGKLQWTWPKLRSLSLEGIYAYESEWISLIKLYRDTLKKVSFRRCSIKTGLWAEVVDELVFGSSIGSFVLDRADELDNPVSRMERDSWEYEGHLVVTEDGDRIFVRGKRVLKICVSYG